MSTALLSQAISRSLNAPVLSMTSVSGGSINEAYKVTVKGLKHYFVKTNNSGLKGVLAAELQGLTELAKCKELLIPEVISYDEGDNEFPQHLILEYLCPTSRTPIGEQALAHALATIHQLEGGSFGYMQDNFIGTLHQINVREKQWGTFFRRYRLEVQGDLATQNGWLIGDLSEKFQELLPRIESELNALTDPPVLLHGDLWSGNIHWTEQGPYLIDPAVYYGNREADIAFTEFFGGLSDAFYNAYNEHLPLADGYFVRKEIYNLYHTMTHANMFGGGYIGQFEQMCNWLLSEFYH